MSLCCLTQPSSLSHRSFLFLFYFRHMRSGCGHGISCPRSVLSLLYLGSSQNTGSLHPCFAACPIPGQQGQGSPAVRIRRVPDTRRPGFRSWQGIRPMPSSSRTDLSSLGSSLLSAACATAQIKGPFSWHYATLTLAMTLILMNSPLTCTHVTR